METGTATRSTTVSAARETLRPSSLPPPPPSSNTPATTTAAAAAAAASTSSTTSVRCAALVYFQPSRFRIVTVRVAVHRMK